MIAFRSIEDGDVETVVALWTACGLTRPWNDARRDVDFARGKANSDILIGEDAGELVSSILVGHDGHRGWYYYLSVKPSQQGRGLGKATV
ncbi:MAG TPA: GNAT family N-acetyltransferase, partial [Nordella sp.]|nr:GNAT family N-acetyltransferase [Nordella sp.]